MDLTARWPRLLGAIGGRDDSKAVFDDLDGRYREYGRFYHTWEHVAACLAELDAARSHCDRPAEIELAMWFHDAVYDPRAADNEARSAELLRGAAERLGIDAAPAERAAVLVLATAHLGWTGEAPGHDAAIVRDIDLAILGSAPDRYHAYEAAVRREYGFLSDAAWRAGRSKVLSMFLDLPRIYLTAAFHDRLERQARQNLAASLEEQG